MSRCIKQRRPQPLYLGLGAVGPLYFGVEQRLGFFPIIALRDTP
jgi:hypothetical protein